MNSIKTALIVACVLAVPGSAVAATAVATTDVNVRTGPGSQFPVIGAIEQNATVELIGCLPARNWCRVVSRGRTGWSYGRYFAAGVSGRTVLITEEQQPLEIPTLTYVAPGDSGPGWDESGTSIRWSRRSTVVTAIQPPPRVYTYVVEHPREPALIDDEVVVGAGIPESVELYPIPEYGYRYAYVNERPVLVQPDSRRIVHVYR